jgi:hypothetical protein
MLSDREADKIERDRRQRVGGPVVLKWLDQLLQDRRERVQQLEHLRKRLHQAFRYLDGLVGEARQGQSVNLMRCPKCGRRYERRRVGHRAKSRTSIPAESGAPRSLSPRESCTADKTVPLA